MINGIKSVREGGKRALSEALALTEHSFDNETTIELLDEAYGSATAHVVGFTGPPGVGKSTLINGLIKEWRRRDKTVGVIAIDPSSHKTGGALLGDRTRMITDPEDQGIFVRSLASRGQLGGVAQLTFPALVLMRALFDIVIIETVGVGQSEADITSHADSVILCVQPGSGDSLQFMKSGIMEIPDIAVVTKADMGAQARRAEADLKGALSITNYEPGQQETVVLSVSAAKEEGLPGLIDAIDGHYQTLLDNKTLEKGREAQAIKWLQDRILNEYGSKGLSLVEKSLSSGIERPFKKQHFVLNGLITSFRG